MGIARGEASGGPHTLGDCGLRVSTLGLGTWLSFGTRLDDRAAAGMVAEAFGRGIVLFDTAAGYGPSEQALGTALRAAGIPRDDVVVSTKLFPRRTLSRKHVRWTLDQSLERLGMPFVDIISCHRYDPATPLTEVVHTMSEIVSSGRAHYWGTSHWTSVQIRDAIEVASRHGWHPPVAAQPGYSLCQRTPVEDDYRGLIEDGHGIMTYSPLGYGLLAGAYLEGTPTGSRAGVPGQVGTWLRDALTSPDLNERVRRLARLADRARVTLPQFALAWVLADPIVDCAIVGPETVPQLVENLAAVDVASRLGPELRAEAAALFDGVLIEPPDV